MSIDANNKFEHANVTCMKRSDSDKECQISENLSSPPEKEAKPNNDLERDSEVMKLPISPCREEDITDSERKDLLIPSPSSAHMKMREMEDKKKEIEFQSIKEKL